MLIYLHIWFRRLNNIVDSDSLTTFATLNHLFEKNDLQCEACDLSVPVALKTVPNVESKDSSMKTKDSSMKTKDSSMKTKDSSLKNTY